MCRETEKYSRQSLDFRARLLFWLHHLLVRGSFTHTHTHTHTHTPKRFLSDCRVMPMRMHKPTAGTGFFHLS